MIIFPMKAALLVRPCENDVLVLQSQVFTTKKKKRNQEINFHTEL